MDVPFSVRIFREGETFVAHVPELDISSCAADKEHARTNIQDAVRGFLETIADQGRLDEILSECGYYRDGNEWRAPQLISEEHMKVAV